MSKSRTTNHKCPYCGGSMSLRGGRYEGKALRHLIEVAQCDKCGHSIDARLLPVMGAAAITKEEAQYQDARRELMLALASYCANVARTPRPDDKSGADVWDWCEERFGYELRARANLYNLRAQKMGCAA